MSSARRRSALVSSLVFAAAMLASAAVAAADPAADPQSTPPSPAAAPADPAAESKPVAPPPPQQFLAVLRPVPRLHDESAWKPVDNEAVGRHFRRLQEAAAAGTVIFAGRTEEPLDTTMGLIVFEAADAAAARAWAEADPAVVAGVMTVEVRPYALAVARR